MKRTLLLLTACSSMTMGPPPDVATGDVASWATGPDLPVPRANHCSAAIGDWVLVIGGNHAEGSGFAKTDEIDAAELGADGALGPWQVAGHTASPVSECTATSDGSRLYVIDGLYDTDTDNGQVFTADLDPTGHLSALTSSGKLPAGVVAISSEAAVRDGVLSVMHSELPAEGDTTVTLRTPITGDVAWTTDDWHIGFRAQAEYAFTADTTLIIGGYGGDANNTVLPDVFTAPIAGGGPVTTATPLPAPVAFGEAVAADDWVFVAGGRDQVFGAAATTAVYAAQLATDGTLGTWRTATPLPVARTNHDMVLAGDFLVLTGGAASGPGDATVLVARVRYPQ